MIKRLSAVLRATKNKKSKTRKFNAQVTLTRLSHDKNRRGRQPSGARFRLLRRRRCCRSRTVCLLHGQWSWHFPWLIWMASSRKNSLRTRERRGLIWFSCSLANHRSVLVRRVKKKGSTHLGEQHSALHWASKKERQYTLLFVRLFFSAPETACAPVWPTFIACVTGACTRN